MERKFKNKGFTLIELLVVVVVIGLIAAMALPNFIGAQRKAKISQVKSNMHTCQLAAECYGTDMGGVYSSVVAGGIDAYYPGGGNRAGGTAGTFPPNPFTNISTAPIYRAVTTTIPQMRAMTVSSQPAFAGNAGLIVYGASTPATTYAVMGLDDAGRIVGADSRYCLVLSNQ